VSLEVQGRDRRRAGRQRRPAKVDHAEGDHPNLLSAERGRGHQGLHHLRRSRRACALAQRARCGAAASSDGRPHWLAHLSVEENLLTGAFTRREGKAAIRRDVDLVYSYSAPEGRRGSTAGYISGGEQEMCAHRRALIVRPKMILLGRRPWGSRRSLVEVIFADRRNLNAKEGVSFLLAEQNTRMALRLRAPRLCAGSTAGGARRRAKAVSENEESRSSISAWAEGRRKRRSARAKH